MSVRWNSINLSNKQLLVIAYVLLPIFCGSLSLKDYPETRLATLLRLSIIGLLFLEENLK